MADNPDGQSCGNCFYEKEGVCRVAPPTVVLRRQPNRDSEIVAAFPPVQASDWCGDWKPVPA